MTIVLVGFVDAFSARIVGELEVVETVSLRIGHEAQHDRGARVPADRIPDLALVDSVAGLILGLHAEIERNAIRPAERGPQLVDAALHC